MLNFFNCLFSLILSIMFIFLGFTLLIQANNNILEKFIKKIFSLLGCISIIIGFLMGIFIFLVFGIGINL